MCRIGVSGASATRCVAVVRTRARAQLTRRPRTAATLVQRTCTRPTRACSTHVPFTVLCRRGANGPTVPSLVALALCRTPARSTCGPNTAGPRVPRWTKAPRVALTRAAWTARCRCGRPGQRVLLAALVARRPAHAPSKACLHLVALRVGQQAPRNNASCKDAPLTVSCPCGARG